MAKLNATSINGLVSVLRDKKRPIMDRRKACCAIGDLKLLEGFSTLLEAIADHDEHLPWIAANALVMLPRRGGATEKLIEIIGGSSNRNVRQAAIYALGLLGDHLAHDLLVKVAANKSRSERHTRNIAIQALGGIYGAEITSTRQLRELIIDSLEDKSPEVRYSSLCVLTSLKHQHPSIRRALQKRLHDSARIPKRGTVGRLARSLLNSDES